MPMTIPPSAHALRFGKVPAKLERLHEGVNITPTSDEHLQSTLQLVQDLEKHEKLLAESDFTGHKDLLSLSKGLLDLDKDVIGLSLELNLDDGNYGAIETVYQAIKALPTFTLRERRDPVYAALAKAFKQFKRQAAK